MTAIDQNGSSCVTASLIRVVGGYAGTCLDPQPVAASPDLYSPSFGGCDHNGKVNDGNVTPDPGVYCKGMDITGGAHVTFNPGEYILNGRRIKAAGGSRLEGEGVVFYLTGDHAGARAAIEFGGEDESLSSTVQNNLALAGLIADSDDEDFDVSSQPQTQVVSYCTCPGGAPVVCDDSCSGNDLPRHYVEVTASDPFSFLVPMPMLGSSMTLSETVSMRLE